MTTTAANILNEMNTRGEIVDARRTRIARILGKKAVMRTLHHAGQVVRSFWNEHKAPLLTAAGALTMMAGLSGAALGAANALQTETHRASTAMSNALTGGKVTGKNIYPADDANNLAGGGIALILAGTSAVAYGLSYQQRRAAAKGNKNWNYIQPTVVGGEIIDADDSPDLAALDGMLSAAYRPTIWERLDTVYETAKAEREANSSTPTPEDTTYDGFATYAVPGAMDINMLTGLSTA